MGVSIIRTIVYWGLYWGPPILGNYHIGILLKDCSLRSLLGINAINLSHSVQQGLRYACFSKWELQETLRMLTLVILGEYRGYIVILGEYRDYIGIMEKKMETTIYWGLGLRV